MDFPPVVVFPPRAGARRVTVSGNDAGPAYRLSDLVEILCRAGLNSIDVETSELIEWRGGGPDVWAE